MEKQYKDSVTTNGAAYKANVPIGSYEGSSSDMGKNNLYMTNNMAYPEASIPTPENSKRKSDVSQLSPELDSPANVGNSSC